MGGSGKWFAIFVIILFLVSTFAVMLYTNSSGADKNKPTSVNTKDLVPITYTATATGTVKELPVNGSFLLQAYTNETDVTLLDSYLKDVNNVYNVNSQLKINPDTNKVNASYVYIANISGEGVDYNTLKNAILDTNYFLPNSVIYPFAKVDYNSNLHFVNKDLNLTKDYSLGGSEIAVLVNPDTILNDKIQFTLTAHFKGDILKSYDSPVIETQNLSAQPKAINSLYQSDFNKTGYSILILNADKNFSESDFNFINKLDYNYQYFGQNNNAKLDFNLSTNFSKLISDVNSKLISDFNAQVNYLILANVFVDKISYMDKNYDVNKNIDISSDINGIPVGGLDYFKYKDANKLEYNIKAYLIRDKVVESSAEVLQTVSN